MALSILLWVGTGLLAFLFLVEVVMRVIRRYVHFPIPSLLARFIDNPIRRRIQSPSKVVDWIEIEDGMCILEIGPASGTFTVEAARRVGHKGKVLAVDIAPSAIKRLDRRLGNEGLTDVQTGVASAHNLPFSDGTFDRVFMVAVLAEIPHRREVLREVRRVMKDDGILAIGEIVFDPDYPRRRTVAGWCREAGFNSVSIHGSTFHYLATFRKAIENPWRQED